MKTRKVLLAVAAVAATIAGVACSSGKKSNGGGPTPTPTPAGPKSSYTLTGSGFTPNPAYNGDIVGFRVLQGTTVVFCTTAGTVQGGNIAALTATSALSSGLAYHGEAYVSVDGNSTYDTAGDLSFYDPAVGSTEGTFVATTAGRAWAVSKTPTQAISWPSGKACQ